MNPTELEQHVARMEYLERENRRLWRSLRMLQYRLPLCLLAMICCGAALQQIGRFEKSVEVYDRNKVLRAILFADGNNERSGLILSDRKGNSRMMIGANQVDDPSVKLRDGNGVDRIEFGIDPKGEAYFVLRKGDSTWLGAQRWTTTLHRAVSGLDKTWLGRGLFT